MFKYNYMMFLMFGFTVVFGQADDRGYIVELGDIAPSFSVMLDDSTQFNLEDHRGKIVMLQFTASWCSVCRKEMPYIESEIWQEHLEDKFVLIGLDRDEPLEKVLQLKESTAVSYPLGLDDNADVFGLFANKKSGVTRNVIIDENGKIIMLTRLFDREEFDEMKACISKAIEALD